MRITLNHKNQGGMSMYAVITGASSGIGAQFAKRLARDGYDLILVARREDRLKQLEKKITARYKNINCVIFTADLLKLDECQRLMDYIEKPMTATWFANDNKKAPSREIVTAEVIYYYMVALQIPFECERWHFNKLMTLIRVCNEKNKPPKKMGTKTIMSRNQALNALRRQQLGSTG